MRKVTSKDGTTIAFDQLGQGHEVAPQALAPVLIGFFED